MENVSKILETQPKIISKRRYVFLKSFSKLTNAEQDQVNLYEETHPNKPNQYNLDYIESLKTKKQVNIPPIQKKWLWESFLRSYLQNSNNAFIQNSDTLENIKPLVFYFLDDFENFKQCATVSKLSAPSLDKGLLIVGNYGNGKTSIFKALESVLKPTKKTFKFLSTNNLVSMFESCADQYAKDDFYNLVYTGTRYFDDVKTERMASNYGKTELMKDILEERYTRQKTTYLSCNYNDKYPNNLQEALQDFGIKYGARVYDRMFEMFNIIQFKGQSFRK